MEVAHARVEAARGGDEAALAALLRDVWPDAYRIAWSVVHDRALAEDAAQEACAHLVVSLPRLRDVAAFRAWFLRIVVHAAIAQARRRRPETPMADAARAVDAADVPMAAGTAATGTDLGERIDVRRAVAALPALYRLPLVLRYYGDLSSAEIARVLGVPPGTVRYRLAVARERLRAQLAVETNSAADVPDVPDAPDRAPVP